MRYAEFDASKSLVSTAFKPRPLLIGNPEQPQSLIDFGLIRPKPQVQPAGLLQADRAWPSPKAKAAAAL